MDAAFGSPEGGATAADYGQIAPPGSRMFVVAVD
jgi:Flp pilus assembly pilin Flp